MGKAASITQQHLQKNSSELLSKLPQLPKFALDLNTFNNSFVNLCMLVGAVATIKTTLYVGKQICQYASHSLTVPTKQQLSKKYGKNSFALIVDAKANMPYIEFLGKNEFNMILMGNNSELNIIKDTLEAFEYKSNIQFVLANWKQDEKDQKKYENLKKEFQNYDISIVVLPKADFPNHPTKTSKEEIPILAHTYLMMTVVGQKMNKRDLQTAVILPSHKKIKRVGADNGLSHAVADTAESFGKIMASQLKDKVEFVIAKGSVQNAFIGLGHCSVTF